MASDIQTKTCTKCKRELPVTAFHKRGDRDGYRARCKICAIEDRKPRLETIRKRSRAWRAADPGRSKASSRRSWATHSQRRNAEKYAAEGTPEGRIRKSQQYMRHRAQRLANQKRRDALRQAEIKAYRRQYWRDNPDKAREYANRRRALKRDAPGSHTAQDIIDIRRAQKDRCAACRIPLKGKGHVDHRKALVRGGANDRKNLQLLCGTCNCRKRDKDETDFMRENGLLL